MCQVGHETRKSASRDPSAKQPRQMTRPRSPALPGRRRYGGSHPPLRVCAAPFVPSSNPYLRLLNIVEAAWVTRQTSMRALPSYGKIVYQREGNLGRFGEIQQATERLLGPQQSRVGE